MAEYRVNKTTSIFKQNPNKKDMFGDIGTDVVGTLQTGAIIEIANVGSGGRGVVATPYLFFADGTYIIGYDADKYVSPFGDTKKLFNALPDYRLDPPSKPIDNDLLNKEYQDAKNQQNALNQQNNLTSKYVFNQDFEAIGSNMIDKNRTHSHYEKLTHKFKKGDVFEGKLVPVNAGVNPEAKAYNIEIITPNNYTEDGRFVMYNGIFQVPENVVSKQTFLEKNKTNLLIVGVLVLGYLAYKKFNK